MDVGTSLMFSVNQAVVVIVDEALSFDMNRPKWSRAFLLFVGYASVPSSSCVRFPIPVP